MKRIILTIGIMIVLCCDLSYAEIPHLISYQGILQDSCGAPVADNIYPLKFRIYKSPSGDELLWESADYISIRTTNCRYSHVLGSTSLLPDTLAKFSDLWLGVKIGLAEEIRPRTLILNNPASFSEPEKKDSVNKPKDTSQNNEILTLDSKYLKNSANSEIIKTPEKPFSAQQPTLGFLLKYGIDLIGKHRISASGQSASESVNAGMTGAIEFYLVDQAKATRLGLGLEYQLPRSQSDYEGDFNFLSYYIALRISSLYKEQRNNYTLVTLKLGHAQFSGDSNYKGSGEYEADLNGGFHFGVGLGVLLSDVFLIEGIYEVNVGNIELWGNDFDIKYSRLYISMGINVSGK